VEVPKPGHPWVIPCFCVGSGAAGYECSKCEFFLSIFFFPRVVWNRVIVEAAGGGCSVWVSMLVSILSIVCYVIENLSTTNVLVYDLKLSLNDCLTFSPISQIMIQDTTTTTHTYAQKMLGSVHMSLCWCYHLYCVVLLPPSSYNTSSRTNFERHYLTSGLTSFNGGT
jgi:hypothetical protein